jgi:predicted nucleic acid-binding protein
MFWPDDQSLFDSFKYFDGRVVGHQQVTDAYLLALARVGGDALVTFDRAVLALAGRENAATVQLLSA